MLTAPHATAALVIDWRCSLDFAVLAVIVLAGLVGPLLAMPRRWQVPVVVGELFMGIMLGRTGLGYLDASDDKFSFLAEVGFGLVMFVAGTHVPVHDVGLRRSLARGTSRAVLVGAGSAVLGVLLAAGFGTGHAALYAVLMASSSAALILPIIDSLDLGGEHVLQLLPQVAVADAVCIVAVPLVIDPAHVGRAALGALAVILAGALVFVVLFALEHKGLRRRLHRVSEERHFALELRISLIRAIHLTGPMQVRRLSMVEPLVACPWSAGGPVFPAVRAGSASAGGRRPGRGSALERGRRPVRARGRRPCRGCEIGVG